MSRLKFGFTIRSMMIAVALVALHLAAAIATWNGYPREQMLQVRSSISRLHPPHAEDADGNIRFDLDKLETGERLVGIVRRPHLRRTLVEIWAPVIASASITLLVLDILWCQARRQRTGPVTDVEKLSITLTRAEDHSGSLGAVLWTKYVMSPAGRGQD
jgi:hypothetical protein